MSVVRMLPLVLVFQVALAGPALRGDEESSLAADEAIVKGAGLRTDGPALLEFFAKLTLDAGDKATLQRLIEQLGDQSFRVREKASAELKKWGRSALPYLRRAT